MPTAAIRSGCVDFVVPLDRIADVLVALVMTPGVAPLFRVPLEASLARARGFWGVPAVAPSRAAEGTAPPSLSLSG